MFVFDLVSLFLLTRPSPWPNCRTPGGRFTEPGAWGGHGMERGQLCCGGLKRREAFHLGLVTASLPNLSAFFDNDV